MVKNCNYTQVLINLLLLPQHLTGERRHVIGQLLLERFMGVAGSLAHTEHEVGVGLGVGHGGQAPQLQATLVHRDVVHQPRVLARAKGNKQNI